MQKWPVRSKVSQRPKDSVSRRTECSTVSNVAEKSSNRVMERRPGCGNTEDTGDTDQQLPLQLGKQLH